MGVHTSREVEFGALTLKFETFEDSEERQGKRWPTSSDDGFFLLGGTAVASEWWTRVRSTNPEDDMVRKPVDWKMVGKWHGGDSYVWRPVPPEGYKVFSDFDMDERHDPWTTGLDDVVGCVKETHDGFTYAHVAEAEEAKSNMWLIKAPDYWYGTNGIRMIPGMGARCYSEGPPKDVASVHVLNLPVRIAKGSLPQKPLMDSFSKPVDDTDWVTEREIIVPFPAVKDSEKDYVWQVDNSPTYTLRREVRYHLEKFIDNEHSSTEQSVGYSVTQGITQTQTDTWSAKVGISVSAKAGFDIEAVKAEVSTTLSVEMGYSSATSVSEMNSRTDIGTLKTPGFHAGAMYSSGHRLKAIREDGNTVGGEDSSISFTPNQDYYYPQYPEAADHATSVEALSTTTTASPAPATVPTT
ncbi:hypothetical protein ACFCZ4_32775 [Streptomyces microflavus]|uniref:hypothetical protein n=1 Tax=Streptomyces microflavus TaxID=1919 RepID=UPI0035D9F91D